MTVGQLIRALQDQPHYLDVLVPGYETGADEVERVNRVVVEDKHSPGRPSFYGRYEIAHQNKDATAAVYICGRHDPLS